MPLKANFDICQTTGREQRLLNELGIILDSFAVSLEEYGWKLNITIEKEAKNGTQKA